MSKSVPLAFHEGGPVSLLVKQDSTRTEIKYEKRDPFSISAILLAPARLLNCYFIKTQLSIVQTVLGNKSSLAPLSLALPITKI